MFRTILKILAVLVILVVIFLLWALKKVDYTPYFHSEYYLETRARLDSALLKTNLHNGPVFLGFGRASITPEIGAEQNDASTGHFQSATLAGYGNRKGAPMTGVHDSVFVTSIAIQVDGRTLYLVSADLLIIPPGIATKVADELADTGIRRGQLFFSATHTHSSVGGWSKGIVGEAFGGQYSPDMVRFLADRIGRAIAQSHHDLRPGSIGTGKYDAPGYVRNRLVGKLGTTDDDFVFLVLQQADGKKAVIGSFAGHATTLGAGNMEISGDYPGYWQRKIQRSGVDMAVFFAGSVGSHSVRGGHGSGFERSESIGDALADSTIRYIEQLDLSDSAGLAFASIEMQLPPLHVRLTDGWRMNEWLAGQLFPPIGTPSIQAARIGDLVWATTPSDFSGESAQLLKNMVENQGLQGLVSSFNGAYVGYIIPCKYYHLNEYESRTMSWFGPYMGPYTQEILRRMMAKMASLGPSERMMGEKEKAMEAVGG